MLFPFKIQIFVNLAFDEVAKLIEYIGSEYLNEPMSLALSIFEAKISRELPPQKENNI